MRINQKHNLKTVSTLLKEHLKLNIMAENNDYLCKNKKLNYLI